MIRLQRPQLNLCKFPTRQVAAVIGLLACPELQRKLVTGTIRAIRVINSVGKQRHGIAVTRVTTVAIDVNMRMLNCGWVHDSIRVIR